MDLTIVNDDYNQEIVNRVMDAHDAYIDGECPDWNDEEKYPRKQWLFFSDLPGDELAPFVVVDNRSGDCWVEQFSTLDGALLYVTDVYTTCEHQIDWDYHDAIKDRIGWKKEN